MAASLRRGSCLFTWIYTESSMRKKHILCAHYLCTAYSTEETKTEGRDIMETTSRPNPPFPTPPEIKLDQKEKRYHRHGETARKDLVAWKKGCLTSLPTAASAPFSLLALRTRLAA